MTKDGKWGSSCRKRGIQFHGILALANSAPTPTRRGSGVSAHVRHLGIRAGIAEADIRCPVGAFVVIESRTHRAHRRQTPVGPGDVAHAVEVAEARCPGVGRAPVHPAIGAVAAGLRVVGILEPGDLQHIVVDQAAAAVLQSRLRCTAGQQANPRENRGHLHSQNDSP